MPLPVHNRPGPTTPRIANLPPGRFVILKIKPATIVAAGGSHYAAASIEWRINPRKAANRSVLAVETGTGTILEVFGNIQWRPSTGGRSRFTGIPDPSPSSRALVGKQIPAAFRGPHQSNPVRYA